MARNVVLNINIIWYSEQMWSRQMRTFSDNKTCNEMENQTQRLNEDTMEKIERISRIT